MASVPQRVGGEPLYILFAGFFIELGVGSAPEIPNTCTTSTDTVARNADSDKFVSGKYKPCECWPALLTDVLLIWHPAHVCEHS